MLLRGRDRGNANIEHWPEEVTCVWYAQARRIIFKAATREDTSAYVRTTSEV